MTKHHKQCPYCFQWFQGLTKDMAKNALEQHIPRCPKLPTRMKEIYKRE